MKQSNTYQSSFSHNDTIYELWHDSRYDMQCIYDKLEDSVSGGE